MNEIDWFELNIYFVCRWLGKLKLSLQCATIVFVCYKNNIARAYRNKINLMKYWSTTTYGNRFFWLISINVHEITIEQFERTSETNKRTIEQAWGVRRRRWWDEWEWKSEDDEEEIIKKDNEHIVHQERIQLHEQWTQTARFTHSYTQTLVAAASLIRALEIPLCVFQMCACVYVYVYVSTEHCTPMTMMMMMIALTLSHSFYAHLQHTNISIFHSCSNWIFLHFSLDFLLSVL